MGFAALALPALTSLAGGLSNRSKTTTQATKPVYDDLSQGLRDQLIYDYSSLADDGDFWPAYQQNALQQIQATGDRSSDLLNTLLTSRGIARTSGGATSIFNQDLFNRNQRGNFLTQMPLRRDQRKRDLLKERAGFLSSLPVGQETKTTDPGNILGGAVSGFAGALGSLYGKNAGSVLLGGKG